MAGVDSWGDEVTAMVNDAEDLRKLLRAVRRAAPPRDIFRSWLEDCLLDVDPETDPAPLMLGGPGLEGLAYLLRAGRERGLAAYTAERLERSIYELMAE
jgi:hypothetical protein